MALTLDGTTGITSDSGTPVIENLNTTATGIDITGQLTTTGNVGIGTSSPTDKLTVSNGGVVVNGGNVKVTDGSTAFQMGVNNFATGYGMGTTSNTPLIFAANGSERMRIDPAGRVTMPYQPAFMARPSGDYSPVAGSGQVFQLGTVLKNQGNHWASNVFTCPVDGMYLVTFTAYYNPATYNGYVGAYITTTAGTYYSFGPPGGDVTVTMSVVIPQAANDGIRFYTYSASSSNQLRSASSASIILLS